MNKPVKALLFYLSFLVFLTNCEENPHFERPESLEPPLYQQLQARGNFTNFLALVDKANYTQSLSGAGYYTLFAPTDEAFEIWFQENGIANVDAIDEATAREIVTYAIVFNSYTVERLSDYQSQTGWDEDKAFKRKTAYYQGVYKAQNVKVGEQIMPEINVVSSNLHSAYLFEDNGNKYIPYFTADYFSAQNLSAADYEYFFPNTPYSGFNVAGANVIEANLAAENGMLHIIDKVIEPLPNAEQQLATNDNYEAFRSIMELNLTQYDVHSRVTERYAVMAGSSEPVYVKFYDPALVFSPNSENWQDPEAGTFYENESQANHNTIFAPSNAAVNEYVRNTLLQFYPNKEDIGQLPQDVIADFVSAHMWSQPVWPTKFETTRNSFGDPARFDPQGDVKEKQMLSNGFFYGTDKVLESNVFHSVYGRAYLDPQYSMMIDILGLQAKLVFTQKDNLYTMFLVSNQALTDAGFAYDDRFREWVYTPPQGGATVTGSTAKTRLDRVINQHVALMEEMDDYADLSGEGVIRTYNDEYIKFENGNLFTAGNQDNDEVVNITEGPIYTDNGIVYLIDRILDVSDRDVTAHIQENFEESLFWQYLVNSMIYDTNTFSLEGTSPGTPYTVFVPTDEAVEAAIADGLLPATEAGEPNFTPAASTEQDLVNSFIRYHFIANAVVVDKGEDLADISYQTLFRNLEGEIGMLNVSDGDNGVGPTVVTDRNGRTATVIEETSNILSNWAVIHQIDNYLDYRLQ